MQTSQQYDLVTTQRLLNFDPFVTFRAVENVTPDEIRIGQISGGGANFRRDNGSKKDTVTGRLSHNN